MDVKDCVPVLFSERRAILGSLQDSGILYCYSGAASCSTEGKCMLATHYHLPVQFGVC